MSEVGRYFKLPTHLLTRDMRLLCGATPEDGTVGLLDGPVSCEACTDKSRHWDYARTLSPRAGNP